MLRLQFLDPRHDLPPTLGRDIGVPCRLPVGPIGQWRLAHQRLEPGVVGVRSQVTMLLVQYRQLVA